jgi:hypothetical protein
LAKREASHRLIMGETHLVEEETANIRAAGFLNRALDRFRSLARDGRTISRDFLVADLKLRIKVAKGLFEQSICRPFMHLAVPSFEQPDLTVSAWDSESSGLSELRLPWTPADYKRYGVVSGFNDSRYHTAVQFDPIIVRLLDRRARRAVYWMQAVRELPPWEIGAPLRPLLHEWLLSRGKLPVHGGAVGYRHGGVFLAGSGGSGKSNVALGCLNSDLLYAADDFCVLTDEPEWRIHSLYCSGKIAGGDLPRHPHLAGHVSNADALDSEKALFFVHESFPEKIIRTMPLRAIVMPQVMGFGRSEIMPATAAGAQLAVAMSTIELSPWTVVSTFSQVARFVRALPCFTLRIGEDSSAVPSLIATLLSRLS